MAGENNENNEELNYQEMYEAEKGKVEKISGDYKSMESRANQLKNQAVKIRSTLEDKGLAEFDDDWNVTVINNQQSAAQLSEEDAITADNNSLAKQFEDGDIDQGEYIQKLNANNLKIANMNAKSYYAEQEQARQTQASQDALSNDIDGMLNNYKDHADDNSVLFKEMKRVYDATPNVYGDPNANNKDRLVLAQIADSNLKAAGNYQQQKSNAINNQYGTFQGGSQPGVLKQEQGGLTDSEKILLTKGGYGDSKLLESLNKDFANYKAGQGVQIDF